MSVPTTFDMLYVIMRLNRWGWHMRWLQRGGSDPTPKRVASWWDKVITRRLVQNHEQQSGVINTCPVDIEEAHETQRCIDVLRQHLRDVIIQEYAIGGSAEQKAEDLGIETSAFRKRREKAHVLLLGLFNDAAAGVPLNVPEVTRGRPPVRRCVA